MILTNKALARRTFLRGLGATIALPFMDSMVPAFGNPATAAAKPTMRLGFVYHPVGMIMNRWTPAAEGAAFELTPTMLPLAPFRDRMLVLSGLAQVQGRALGDGPGDHAREGATWLTGVHPKRSESDVRAGISADQIAAKEFGKHTQLASLELTLEAPTLAGSCDQNYSCAYTNTVCWSNPTNPLPMEPDPRALFERLFGDGDSTEPAARLARLNEERSILDYVCGSIDRLQTKLGSGDRSKLSDYLDAVRNVERRIQTAEQQNASTKLAVMERPDSIPEDFDEHAKLMMDLQVLAYQTDMTRVITLMLGRAGSNRPYPFIGVPDGHHSVTHHMNDPAKIEKVAKIDAHLVKTFAYLVEKLKSTPDGQGSLLDHTLIVYGSSLSDGNLHTHDDLPTVLVGGAAGQIKGGRHIRYPKETPLNNLFLNVLDKAGVHCDKFGDSSGELNYLADV
jgi:hypothetical protein